MKDRMPTPYLKHRMGANGKRTIKSVAAHRISFHAGRLQFRWRNTLTLIAPPVAPDGAQAGLFSVRRRASAVMTEIAMM